MNNSKKLALAAGFLAAFHGASAIADELYVLGPVERVSQNGSSVTVLGQTYALPRGGTRLSSLSIGAYVYVVGERLSTGQLVATRIAGSKQPYVAGASEVFLTGIVSKTELSTGFLSVGELKVYVADATVRDGIPLALGETLEIVGTQAQPLGAVWAREIRVLNGNLVAQGIQGTGTSGIQGTGTSGIQGTGTSGIQGTGTTGIQGTGTSGIQGTGTLGIQGTGKSGIQGTGTSGIQGTGTLGIQGTGTSGIQGTGTLGIQGTGTSGIQGTGTSGIQGTGTLGIQGTGTSGIQGTGTSGIQGTGTLGIQGTGTLGIQGTGASY
jgi:hypothetical protein